MVEFTSEANWFFIFTFWRFDSNNSSPLLVINLFRFFISSWFSLGGLYIDRNVSIFSRLSKCWHMLFMIISWSSLCYISYISSFTSNFIYLNSHSSFQYLVKCLFLLFIPSKNSSKLYCFFLSCFYFSYFYFASTNFGLSTFFFLYFLERYKGRYIIDLPFLLLYRFIAVDYSHRILFDVIQKS